MEGYVQNKNKSWRHIMKRQLGPNQKISLMELYEQYGKKYSLSKGEEFVNWLRNVKLKDKEDWNIVLKDDIENIDYESVVDDTNIDGRFNKQSDNVPPIVKQDFTVEDVVELSVRKAKEKLPTIMDIKLLKYALREAECRAGKDSLCRLLRKRILDLDFQR